MPPVRKSTQKNNEPKKPLRNYPRIAKESQKSCRVMLSRTSMETIRMTSKSPENPQPSTIVRARKSFRSSLTQNVTQQLQSIQDMTVESMYENQLNKSIGDLVSSLKTTFNKKLTEFISANEARVMPQVCRDEVAQLKKTHSHRMADLEAGYRARLDEIEVLYQRQLEQVKRQHDLAIEDVKKKQWCQNCGKGTKHNTMVFCDKKCQNKHIKALKNRPCAMSESEQE